MKVLSFNIRCPWRDRDGINDFIHRAGLIYDKIETEQPEVIAFQEVAGLPVNGQVSAITWNALTDLYSDLYNGQILGEGQYPGFETGVQ